MEISTTRVQRGPNTQLVFTVTVHDAKEKKKKRSNIEDVDGLAEFYLDFTVHNATINSCISFRRCVPNNVEITIMDRDETFQGNCTDEWRIIKLSDSDRNGLLKGSFNSGYDVSLFVLKISISAIILDKPTFKALYDDNDFTDFKIGTNDCVVPVHRSVLCATSDTFRSMLEEDWKGAVKGCLDVDGVTQDVLESFKRYMYFGALPEDVDLQMLLLIGRRYNIHALESLCTYRLAQTVTSDTLMDLLEFAVDYKLAELVMAILQVTPDQEIKLAFETKNDADKVMDVTEKTSMIKLKRIMLNLGSGQGSRNLFC